MPRKKTIASIESEIAKTQDDLVKAKAMYDDVAKSLATLREKKK